jgi:pimeloyl-ACP methyl ester carboxylesterase
MVRRDHTEYMARTIPGAKLIILPDVSHFALLQDPVTYVRTVLDFIDADKGPAAAAPQN